MKCVICGKSLEAHTEKEKDECIKERLLQMPPEKAELYRRQLRLLEKGLKRNTHSIYCLVAILGSFITFAILDLLSFPSAINAVTIFNQTQNIEDFWKNFHIYSLDQYYISWVIPIVVLIAGWFSYRRLNPSEEDIMKRALRESFSK